MGIYIREERFVHGRVASGSVRRAGLIMRCKMIVGKSCSRSVFDVPQTLIRDVTGTFQ
jgi:hypothetical protein